MNALFVKLKMKLFNTDNISSTGIKAMIENITVSLSSNRILCAKFLNNNLNSTFS